MAPHGPPRETCGSTCHAVLDSLRPAEAAHQRAQADLNHRRQHGRRRKHPPLPSRNGGQVEYLWQQHHRARKKRAMIATSPARAR